MFSLVRAILWEEHWARCLFCRRVLPKRGLVGEDREAIEKSGLCSYCQQHYPNSVTPQAAHAA